MGLAIAAIGKVSVACYYVSSLQIVLSSLLHSVVVAVDERGSASFLNSLTRFGLLDEVPISFFLSSPFLLYRTWSFQINFLEPRSCNYC